MPGFAGSGWRWLRVGAAACARSDPGLAAAASLRVGPGCRGPAADRHFRDRPKSVNAAQNSVGLNFVLIVP
jgi:hypothetical protein